jgi:hypothetical protein
MSIIASAATLRSSAEVCTMSLTPAHAHLQTLVCTCYIQTQETVDDSEPLPGRPPSLGESHFGGTLSAVQLLADAERETSPWLYYALGTAEKRSLLTVVRMLGVMCVEHSASTSDANSSSNSSSSSEALLIMGLEAEALREVVARRCVTDCSDVSKAVSIVAVRCSSLTVSCHMPNESASIAYVV